MLASLVAVGAVAATTGWRYWSWSRTLSSARALAAIVSPSSVKQMPASTIDEIQTFSSRYPQDPELAYLLGVAYRRAGKSADARREFTRAERLGFSPEDLRRQHYLLLFQMGQIKESESHLVGIINKGCSDAVAEEIYECLVKGYLADLRLREALLCTDFWIEWRPKSVRARLLRVMVLEMASERPRLIHEYREILTIDPNCAEAHSGIGHLLLNSKDASPAQREFRRCLEIDPKSVDARLGLAASCRHLGEPSQAKALLQETLEEDLTKKDESFALAELGQLAIERRDYKEAVECLRRALRLSPDDCSARYALGLALGRLGDKEAANAELEKSRRLESLDARLSDVMHEIVQRPKDPDPRREAGEILLQLGLKEESLACLLSALRCDKWHSKTHHALARYYDDTGNKDMADRHLAWAEHGSDEPPEGSSRGP